MLASGEPSGALRCLLRYVRDGAGDEAWRARTKVIGEMGNLNLGGALGATISAYNGKPVLLRKGVSFRPSADLSCLELECSVHHFNFLSRRALFSLQPKAKDMVVNFALMVEGREEDELPECVLGTCRICGLDGAKAPAL